jgi:thiol:disulfide interchange protein
MIILKPLLFSFVLTMFGGNPVIEKAESKKTKTEYSINFFQGTWKETVEEAKKQKKLIFVDAYAVWCGPCKWMDANAFTDADAGKFYNKNFINYKFDMEKGEGVQFAMKYRVTAYPTLLYINPNNEEVIYRVMGAKNAAQLISEGENALKK